MPDIDFSGGCEFCGHRSYVCSCPTRQCHACGETVRDIEAAHLPNETAWCREAADHLGDCEWVATKGRRT